MVTGMGGEWVGKGRQGRSAQVGQDLGREGMRQVGKGWEKEGQEGKGKIKVRGRFGDGQKQG